jgi:hypothetical protein
MLNKQFGFTTLHFSFRFSSSLSVHVIMIHIVHQAVCCSVIHSRITAASVVPAPRNLFGDLVGWSFVSSSPTLFVMCII